MISNSDCLEQTNADNPGQTLTNNSFDWSLFNDTFISKMISVALFLDPGLALSECKQYGSYSFILSFISNIYIAPLKKTTWRRQCVNDKAIPWH